MKTDIETRTSEEIESTLDRYMIDKHIIGKLEEWIEKNCPDPKTYINIIPPLTLNIYDFHSSKASPRPNYSGDYEDIAEILQREYGVTRADDPKPVLATYGIGPCVAFAGWSPKHKIGFLTHYDGLTELEDSFGYLLYRILEQLEGESSEFEVRIVGGRSSSSEPMIDLLKSRLNFRDDIRMKLVEEDTGGSEARSIALDTRTGGVYSYDPMQNPRVRKLSELDQMRLVSCRSEARLAYAPNRNYEKQIS